MSTRAQIICFVEEKTNSGKLEAKQLVRLYRHRDGYPTGLGNDLNVGLEHCDGDRNLLACLGRMDYPPEFTDTYHIDIEYLYKIYAGCMGHRDDKKSWRITVMPVSLWDLSKDQMEKLFKPYHPDEKDLDGVIRLDQIAEEEYVLQHNQSIVNAVA